MNSSRTDLRLDWCTHEAARFAVERWHYSRCMPQQKTVKLGVWEAGSFVGTVVYGDGANAGMFKPYGLVYEQGAELVRVALRPGHASAVSRIVSISVRFLRRACPRIRLLISFADPEQGHHGGIYQAAGWIYLGMTEPADEYLVNGKRMHGRALRATRASHRLRNLKAANVMDWARQVLDPRIRVIPGSSKHRYLMPLDDEIRARILPLAQPYPKRAKQATAAVPATGGGAAPTRTLQIL
jgi:hypothetical protein